MCCYNHLLLVLLAFVIFWLSVFLLESFRFTPRQHMGICAYVGNPRRENQRLSGIQHAFSEWPIDSEPGRTASRGAQVDKARWTEAPQPVRDTAGIRVCVRQRSPVAKWEFKSVQVRDSFDGGGLDEGPDKAVFIGFIGLHSRSEATEA
ncbi:hypothetical protein C8R47DRAFT_1070406 [Mycena vitilis]|nr:hypothetical protein C8R47DRAFT_1070406 [Mycena vitilis]